MEQKIVSWQELAEDHPIPLLHRRKLQGEQMLLARVHLEKGCTVARHQHVSEQMAIHVSGRVLWTIGHEGEEREQEVRGGEVVLLPANVPHGVVALEDTIIIDVLSPPAAMGVDSQRE